MSVRTLARSFLKQIEVRLAQLGFSKTTGQTFEKGASYGRTAVHVTLIEHSEDFDVTVDVAVRFDEVEKLVHRSSKLLSKKEKLQTFTLGAELGNIEKGKPHRWAISSESSIASVIDEILKKLNDVGFPYMERYSEPGAAYEVLAKDDRSVWVHSPIHIERAKRAYALLSIIGKRDELAELAERKVAFLKSLNDPAMPLFQKFLSSFEYNGTR
jgi:hypothetical protein